MVKNLQLLFFFLLLCAKFCYAQLNNSNTLYRTILEKDSLLFSVGFNTCDITQFENLLSDNLFFFQKDWKLTTSLSYDHQPYTAAYNQHPSFDNDAQIENWLKNNNVKALGLGIIEGGVLKQVKVFGEIKDGVSAPYNTIFNVASLAKPITTLVALRLVSLGKWKLDEPISNYWTDPDIENDARSKKLTTRIILSHQTGFPNWRYQNKGNKLNFEFDPGTQYQYSGEGFEYLRKALENKFKKSLEQLATELVFQPLNMCNTSYTWKDNLYEPRFAIGYDSSGKPYDVFKNKKANAADDLHTTISDYGNFLVSILNGGNLSENVYQEMIKPQVKTKENKYFGLGFELYDLGDGEYAISHGGSDNGTQCITFLLPKTNQGILIFTNSDLGYKTFNQLLVHYFKEKGEKLIDIEN